MSDAQETYRVRCSERLRMALSEAGHPEAYACWDVRDDAPHIVGLMASYDECTDIAWRAFTVCGWDPVCLTCYRAHDYIHCLQHAVADCGLAR